MCQQAITGSKRSSRSIVGPDGVVVPSSSAELAEAGDRCARPRPSRGCRSSSASSGTGQGGLQGLPTAGSTSWAARVRTRVREVDVVAEDEDSRGGRAIESREPVAAGFSRLLAVRGSGRARTRRSSSLPPVRRNSSIVAPAGPAFVQGGGGTAAIRASPTLRWGSQPATSRQLGRVSKARVCADFGTISPRSSMRAPEEAAGTGRSAGKGRRPWGSRPASGMPGSGLVLLKLIRARRARRPRRSARRQPPRDFEGLEVGTAHRGSRKFSATPSSRTGRITSPSTR